MAVRVEHPEEVLGQLRGKRLVLYGMGTLGREIGKWLEEHGLSYVYADRKAEGEADVIHPDRLASEYRDAYVIVSSNLYFREIREGLLRDGFPEERILSYELFVPKEVAWRDLEDTIDWGKMRPSVELFSSWLDPGITSLVDYGAGQMYLKKFLPAEVAYYPIDYQKRFEETIVCDLNRGAFPEIQADVAVLNGVLEFLATAEDLIRHVCKTTGRQVVLSYMTVDRFPDITGRRASGYVSDLSEERIRSLLEEGGFRLIRQAPDPLDGTDTIYLFERR